MPDTLMLPVIQEDGPAGPNLELDAAFGELERAAKGKPETQYGNTIQPATPPDWKETAALAEALLARTRDLRVMARLAVARLHLEGLPGYASVLATLAEHLDVMWEQVHPQLDPEDENDPLPRANALLLLQDGATVLRPMRDLPLAATPRTGPISWRDIAVANGLAEPEPGREKPSEAMLRAAFAGTPAERLTATRAAVETAIASLGAIAAAFDAHSGPGNAPEFKDLEKLLRDIQKELARYETLARESAEEAAETEAGDAASLEPQAARPRGAQAIQSIVALNSRDEALHALDLAAAYFREHEPSSPLPFLIERAIRLAPLSFLDILRDMAPDGLLQANTVIGRTEE